jgi:hypothetical protein
MRERGGMIMHKALGGQEEEQEYVVKMNESSKCVR